MKAKLRAIWTAGRGLGAGILFDFGGIVVFYALMYTVGLKAAIAGTIVFVAIDARCARCTMRACELRKTCR